MDDDDVIDDDDDIDIVSRLSDALYWTNGTPYYQKVMKKTRSMTVMIKMKMMT